MTTAISITHGRSAVVATPTPSTALSTEMAGVIMPSPYSSAVPKTPIPVSTKASRPAVVRCRSEVSARIPPSPLLLARMTRVRYLREMMTTSAQKASDEAPITPSRLTSRS
jgi:hypothetical protein